MYKKKQKNSKLAFANGGGRLNVVLKTYGATSYGGTLWC